MVLVAGGAGFVGSHLVEKLVAEGAQVRVADDLSHGAISNLSSCIDSIELQKTDLTDLAACSEACKEIDVVFGLAAKVAGIQFNNDHPGDMFRINARISMNMLEAARRQNVKKYLVVSSACVYPRDCLVPTPESEGFRGDPEPTNWGYGWAKRFSEIQGMAYATQYGMDIGIVRPYNTYGPRDHFSLDEAHVIPALIVRILREDDPLVVWGSGKQTRSFIYVKDLVNGMLLAIERYPNPEPINIGSIEEIQISELVSIISKTLNLGPKVVFDTTKPDGHIRRRPDVSKALRVIGFRATTPLSEGIEETVRWLKKELPAPISWR